MSDCLPPIPAVLSTPTSYPFFLVICIFDLSNELNDCVVDYVVGEQEEPGAHSFVGPVTEMRLRLRQGH